MENTDYYESRIKCEFLNYMKKRKMIDTKSIISSEYAMGNTGRRADLAVLTRSKIVGIEIKSKYDRLTRLEDQLKIYTACFDEVIVVLDEKHIPDALRIVPASVSVFELDSKGKIRLLQLSASAPETRKEIQLRLFTLSELRKLAGIGVGDQTKRSWIFEIARRLPGDVVRDAVLKSFRETYSTTSENFWQHVKRKRITVDSLAHLSRFTPARIAMQQKQDEKVRFWNAWREDALAALQEATS